MIGKTIGVAALCLLAGACASVGAPQARGAATDVPGHFLVRTADGGTRPVDPDPACESPLVDPRDNSELILQRAEAGLGDYSPALPRYGLAKDELLRVDCSTGVAVGRYGGPT